MFTETKFMDAGTKAPYPTWDDKPKKVYPRFTVDLGQFPDLAADVDESVDLRLRGRVCGLNHNEYSHTMEIEIQSMAVPHDAENSGNRADKLLDHLKSGRS